MNRREPREAPCGHLVTTANARKQFAEAKALIAKHPEVFGNMTIKTTLDDGGKLDQGRYRNTMGFQLTGNEDIQGHHRQLIIEQNGYGLHARLTVSKEDSDAYLMWVGVPQTTEVESFTAALEKILSERTAYLTKLAKVL